MSLAEFAGDTIQSDPMALPTAPREQDGEFADRYGDRGGFQRPGREGDRYDRGPRRYEDDNGDMVVMRSEADEAVSWRGAGGGGGGGGGARGCGGCGGRAERGVRGADRGVPGADGRLAVLLRVRAPARLAQRRRRRRRRRRACTRPGPRTGSSSASSSTTASTTGSPSPPGRSPRRFWPRHIF